MYVFIYRSRLVNYAYKLYFKDETYYRISNVDDRIENADHRLTDDITAFSTSVAHLYSHITKPLFDCALIAFALARSSKKMGAAVIPGTLKQFLCRHREFSSTYTYYGYGYGYGSVHVLGVSTSDSNIERSAVTPTRIDEDLTAFLSVSSRLGVRAHFCHF